MSTTGNWLKGCGIGCLALIVLNLILVFGGIKLARNTFSKFEDVADLQQELTDRFGPVDEFIPQPDGTVSARRLEDFLAVQEAVYPTSVGIGASMDLIREVKTGQGKKLGKVILVLRNVKSIGHDVGTFLRTRNEALIDARMGLGEYIYIYTIVYHSWLGYELLDIPGENDDGELTSAERLHENLVAMFSAQRDALQELPDHDPELLVRLEREILELRIDEQRIPWQDGLPGIVVDSLSPYRARLEALHMPMSFMLGIGAENEHGGFDFQFN